MMRHWKIGFAGAALVCTSSVFAGRFAQLDVGQESNTYVVAAFDQSWVASLVGSDWGSGRNTSLFAGYKLNLGSEAKPLLASLGPQGLWRTDGTDGAQQYWGIKGSFEAYRSRAWGDTYALLELSTIATSWTLVGQVFPKSWSGMGVELLAVGDDRWSHGQHFALIRKIKDSPWSWRAGVQRKASKAFVGLSYSQ